jgi:hypothetical protein
MPDGRRRDSPPACRVHGGCERTLYRGAGNPDRLIVTDLPLQGGVRLSAQQMAQAAALALGRRDFRAGELRVGIQSCDDSVVRTGLFDPAKCAANARAYARDRRVIGVIGTLNSPCSLAALPELAKAEGRPLAIVSPVNSYVGLTRRAADAPAGVLQSLYPGGRRHFARVYPTDDRQAVALAELADELGARRVAVLDDGDLLYGRSLADRFARAARARGGEVVARHTWDPAASSYRDLAIRVADSRPDAVYLGGVLNSNGAAVLRALRRRLGDEPEMLLSDGFTPTNLLCPARHPAGGRHRAERHLHGGGDPRAARRDRPLRRDPGGRDRRAVRDLATARADRQRPLRQARRHRGAADHDPAHQTSTVCRTAADGIEPTTFRMASSTWGAVGAAFGLKFPVSASWSARPFARLFPGESRELVDRKWTRQPGGGQRRRWGSAHHLHSSAARHAVIAPLREPRDVGRHD